MKKLLTIAVLGFSLSMKLAQADDGTIDFKGSIIGATCTVTPASKTQTVTLGKIATTSLTAVGDTAGASPFSIVLSACQTGATSASIQFGGAKDDINRNILKLSGASPATGVGVAIYEDNNSTIIPIGNNSAAKPVTSGTGSTTYYYVAKYMKTATTVTPGPANAEAVFTVVYN